MPLTIWVAIGIIFIIVWSCILWELWRTPTISDNCSMNEPLTREFLLNRGFCCDNGCKNCPY
jgi:hypothetical protein